MKKVLRFPSPRRSNNKDPIQKERLAENIQRLVWNDPQTFFTLEAVCLAPFSLEIESETSTMLRQLGLIDDWEEPLPEVKEIMISIAENVCGSLAVSV